MLADDEILKMKLREALKQIDEGCIGGVCSIGGSGKSSTGDSVSNKGIKVASLNGMTRQQFWNTDNKEGVVPEKPNTNYKETEQDKPFTGEEEKIENWTQKQLQFENEVRVDEPEHTANDLKDRYVSMLAAEDLRTALDRVTNHFKQSGQDYEVMVRVGKTTKSVPQWDSEIEREKDAGYTPEIPDIPSTEGGHAVKQKPQDDMRDIMPFPNQGEPPF